MFSLPCTRGIHALEHDKMAYVVAKESKKCSLSEPQVFCSVYVLLCQDKHCIIVQEAGFSALPTRVVEIRGQTAFAALSQHHQPEPCPVRAAKWWEREGQQNPIQQTNASLEATQQGGMKPWFAPALLKCTNWLENLLMWRFWFGRSEVHWRWELAPTGLIEQISNLSPLLCGWWHHLSCWQSVIWHGGSICSVEISKHYKGPPPHTVPPKSWL